jgi:hypothetical protein
MLNQGKNDHEEEETVWEDHGNVQHKTRSYQLRIQKWVWQSEAAEEQELCRL